MSGFQVPAKAIEAAARELHGIYYNGCVSWEDTTDRDTSGDEGLRRRASTDALRLLEAAWLVLAEDPDLITRAAESIWEQFDWIGTRDGAADAARVVLAALFGVASPSTKETED